MKVLKTDQPCNVAWPKISWDKVQKISFDMKSNSFTSVGFCKENHTLTVWPLFVIRAATLLVPTCQDATFGLITIAINLLIHPSHSKFSIIFFYCLPYSSSDGSLEDLVLDQLANPWLIFFSILITCLLDILSYSVSHGNFEMVKVLKITVICNLAVASWLLYKIEFHKSQKFHGFLNGSIMEGNYCK